MKRTVSLLLTICMVIAMLPSTLVPLAFAEDEDVKYVYSFNVDGEDKYILLMRVVQAAPDGEGYGSNKWNMYPSKFVLTYRGRAPLDFVGVDPITFDFTENLTLSDGETQEIPDGMTAEETFPMKRHPIRLSAIICRLRQ